MYLSTYIMQHNAGTSLRMCTLKYSQFENLLSAKNGAKAKKKFSHDDIILKIYLL